MAKKPPPKEYQFKPGQSGNPGGRKKGLSITSAIRRSLDEDSEVEVEEEIGGVMVKRRLTWREAIIRNQMRLAAGLEDGSSATSAAEFVAERAEGKVKDVLKLESDSFMPGVTDDEIVKKLGNAGKQGGRGKR